MKGARLQDDFFFRDEMKCMGLVPDWKLLLGFQHYVLALGSIVLIPSLLVPQMGGLMTAFGYMRLLCILSSYDFNRSIQAIWNDTEHARERFVHTMREIQGALIVTSSVQIIIGFSGLWRNIVRFFTPLSMVPLAAFTGLGLYYLGFPLVRYMNGVVYDTPSSRAIIFGVPIGSSL